jgi:hypothetical protein
MMRFGATLAVAGLGVAIPLSAHAKTINFHNANQNYGAYNINNSVYNGLMYGQGAASDPGNNVWNGFGKYGGPGSTAFYGPNNPNSNHGSVPANNPGMPYAWTASSGTAEGSNLFSPTNAGAPNVGNAWSDGTISPISLTMNYIAGDNGAMGGVSQGTPSFVLSHAALVQGTDIGTFTLNHVPAGTYNLFLYGANFDGDRGAAFTVSSGTALNGITKTNNPNVTPNGSAQNTFALGVTYVEFTGVTPNANGVISGTWAAVTNTISGQSGEGDFNGLQLQQVPVPEPTSLGALAAAAAWALGTRRRRRKAPAAP